MSRAAVGAQSLVAARVRRRPPGIVRASVPLGIVLSCLALLRILELEQVGWIQNVLVIFSGLLLAALPFILLGSAVSAAIEVFLPDRVFARLAAVPQRLQVGAAAFGGMVFPVCECGSVPVARRLVQRGLNPSAAVTFMLAAPIVNPIVILSTVFAFQGRDILWLMVGGRVIMGLAIAVIAGLVASSAIRRNGITPHALDHGHERDHGPKRGATSKPVAFAGHLAAEFSFMARLMMIGALVAAILQTGIPANVMDDVSSSAALAILAMIGFAFVLAICSESDAILISSFTSFSPAALLAFLVLGPMMDIKLVALYGGVFGRRFVRVLAPTLVVATFVACLWLEAVLRIL